MNKDESFVERILRKVEERQLRRRYPRNIINELSLDELESYYYIVVLAHTDKGVMEDYEFKKWIGKLTIIAIEDIGDERVRIVYEDENGELWEIVTERIIDNDVDDEEL